MEITPYDADTVAVGASIAGFGDENAIIGADEEVGRLASEEKTGDENIRLGFTIHGAIADGADQDMYSFEGAAGTMVWFDVDQTDIRMRLHQGA